MLFTKVFDLYEDDLQVRKFCAGNFDIGNAACLQATEYKIKAI